MDILVIYVNNGVFWTGVTKYKDNRILPFKGVSGVHIKDVVMSLELMSYVTDDVSLFIKYNKDKKVYRSFLGLSNYNKYDFTVEVLYNGYGEDISSSLDNLLEVIKKEKLLLKKNI